MSDWIVDLKGISKSFPDGGKRLHVLNGLDFAIEEGDYISVVGKSGTGKTTLLNIVSLLDDKYQGTYLFDGIPVKNLGRKALYDLRVKSIGYVFQNHNLIPELNILQNVEVPLGYQGVGGRERRRRAMEALDLVGIADKAKKKVFHLSGGEQQRVSLARALTITPRILIADEPTGNLDPETSKKMMGIMRDINNLGTTILVVTHDDELAKQCQKCYRVLDGVLHRQ